MDLGDLCQRLAAKRFIGSTQERKRRLAIIIRIKPMKLTPQNKREGGLSLLELFVGLFDPGVDLLCLLLVSVGRAPRLVFFVGRSLLSVFWGKRWPHAT